MKATELKIISQILNEGGVIICPTDTIIGLSCQANNFQGFEKIFTIKKRATSKKFILLVRNWEDVQFYTGLNLAKIKPIIINNQYPTTFIYPKAQNLPKFLLNEDGTIALRICTNSTCLQIINSIQFPLVSTSINITGENSYLDLNDIPLEIKVQCDYIIENSQSVTNKPSKIIKINSDLSLTNIR